MASREHSDTRRALLGVGEGAGRPATDVDAVRPGEDRPTARPGAAPTPLTAHGCCAAASLVEGGLAYTRRAVLGAAVAVPVAAGVSGSERPSPPTASRRAPPLPQRAGEEKWQRALAAFRQAEAAKERFDRATRAATAGPGGRSFEEQWALDKRFGDYLVACNAALRRLVRTPAPDLAALAVKIALVVDEDVASLSGSERCMAALKADARRLCVGS